MFKRMFVLIFVLSFNANLYSMHLITVSITRHPILWPRAPHAEYSQIINYIFPLNFYFVHILIYTVIYLIYTYTRPYLSLMLSISSPIWAWVIVPPRARLRETISSFSGSFSYLIAISNRVAAERVRSRTPLKS